VPVLRDILQFFIVDGKLIAIEVGRLGSNSNCEVDV
jgi:hypothetical protein